MNPCKRGHASGRYANGSCIECAKTQARAYGPQWRSSNREHRRAYERRRHAENPLFNLTHRMRCRLGLAFRRGGFDKGSSTAELLGCTWPELVAHIEGQFQPGMTWSNRGQWEIDHRVSLASAKDAEALRALCHYSNLQPLWMPDNRRKGARDIFIAGSSQCP